MESLFQQGIWQRIEISKDQEKKVISSQVYNSKIKFTNIYFNLTSAILFLHEPGILHMSNTPTQYTFCGSVCKSLVGLGQNDSRLNGSDRKLA